MRANVRDYFPNFERMFEGWENTFYRDTKGLVTFGMGNLAESRTRPGVCPQRVLNLFWRNIETGEPASETEIQEDWTRIKALFEDGEGYRRRRALSYRQHARVRLEDNFITEYLRRELDEYDVHLNRVYPDFEKWPSDAQLAIMNMAWNVGVYDFPNGWPNFSRAVRAGDWNKAAEQCLIAGEAARDRNVADVILFTNCAKISWIPDPIIGIGSKASMNEAIWYRDKPSFTAVTGVQTFAIEEVSVSELAGADSSVPAVTPLYVQGMLRMTGYYMSRLDGQFGRISRAALHKFQTGVGARTTRSAITKLSEQTTKIPVVA